MSLPFDIDLTFGDAPSLTNAVFGKKSRSRIASSVDTAVSGKQQSRFIDQNGVEDALVTNLEWFIP